MHNLSLVICNTGNNVLSQFALRHTLSKFPVKETIVFSDAENGWECDKFIKIDPILHMSQYEDIMLSELVEHVSFDHCLVIQYDGFVLNPEIFSKIFLHYDYIGAPWTHYDEFCVGNGGFSLRSKRLLENIKSLTEHKMDDMNEDVFICRHMRSYLEENRNINFAPKSIAEHFSFESHMPKHLTFGFHGLSNLLLLFSSNLEFVVENLPIRFFNPNNLTYKKLLTQTDQSKSLYLSMQSKYFGGDI
jgi:hypothetical protein